MTEGNGDMVEEYPFPHVFDTTRLRHVDELKRAAAKAETRWTAELKRLDAIIASGEFSKARGAAKPSGRPVSAEAEGRTS